MEKTKVLIVGSGIAGSTLAYELEKENAEYMICTAEKNSLSNTTSLGYGHCRTKFSEKLIDHCVDFLGEDRKRIEYVFSKLILVEKFFQELEINYEKKSFGIIPKSKSAKEILEKIQKEIPKIFAEHRLIKVEKKDGFFEATFDVNGKRKKFLTEKIIFATGGYGGSFEKSDCFPYKEYNIFKIVESLGGKIINKESIFFHPFGYFKGKKILVGNEVSKGYFVDSCGARVFDLRISEKLKKNDYHEIFPEILNKIKDTIDSGKKVFFVLEKNKIEITPTVHYTSGGIKTDYLGDVEGVEGAYAVGECRADGSKNGGRLPGYPMSSAIIDGICIAKKLTGDSKEK